MHKYLQLNELGVAYAYNESQKEIIAENIIAVLDDSNLGRKWDGSKFLEAPKKYKVLSALAFATICGQGVFDSIVDGNAKDLRFYKYLLDKADFVDPNIPQYFSMIQTLKTRNIMSQAIYDQIMVLE